ncbi:mediator of DNA damage checkpoint protein 1 isoform X5 [Cavia porcellus]|uniref:mediator of DNA damage checkpoint protein 1 isoform X5 n=1 Tax=Cavia porcellus TaxID=10141 RepID=UPI002FE29006
MEDTQAIDWAAEEEEETEQSGESLGYSLEPVGRLRVFGSTYGPEKDFPLYLGKNVVGRMPDCSVALPFPSISKQHAVIEISAWDKAPVLQDCGSLNGTQILRPPMVLRPGVSHRLRDHELILFADLPCQYRHLEEPMPMPSRGPLSVEETPRIPGDAHASRLPLAEDSDEEEADFLSERCMEKESRITSSPLTTVVPESDDEGPSALGGSGPSSAFNLDSDTDEDEAGKASAVRNSATTKAEQPRGDRITRDPRLVKALPAVKRDRDTEARKDAENRVALERSNPPGEDSDTDVDEDSRPAELHLERAQPSGFEDSDTDVEEEGVPETPAAILGKKRLILGAASTGGPGAHGMAHPQESPAGSDTDVEEQKCPAAGSQDSLVINSDTDDEEEVSAALTLARLKEGRAALWNRGMGTERTRTQPEVPLEQNQTSLDRDSNSALKKRHPVGRKETLPSAHRGKTEALGTAELGASRPPHGDSNAGGTAGKRSHGTHPESSQASSTTVHIKTEVEEGAPLGLAVAHLESRQAPVEGTNHTTKQLVQPLEARPFDKAYAEGDSASAVAAVRQIQRVAGGDAQEMAPEVGTPGRAPAVQGEQVVHTVTPGNPTLPQRGGARTPAGRKQKSYLTRTRSSKDSHDAGCEDLDLQATQCFVESESLEAIQGVEDEPTQAFLCMFSPEPGPSHCSSQAPDALDEPWEVLATQPFCVGESEHPEPRLTATCLQAPRSHLSPPRVAPQDQRPGTPAHVEPLGTEGRELQTVKRDRGLEDGKMPPAESASRDAPLPAAAPQALVPHLGPFVSQSQKCSAPQPLLPPLPSSEPPVPGPGRAGRQEAPEPALSSELKTSRPKPSGRHRPRCRMTSAALPSAAHVLCLPAPIEQPSASAQTSPARTQRSSVRTPEAVVVTALNLQPSTSADRPVVPKPMSRATRGRVNKSSLQMPEAAEPAAPEPQPATSAGQPITPKPASRATRGRTNKSFVQTPEALVHTATSTHQPDTPEPAPQAPRGRANRSSIQTPKPVVPMASKLQPDTPEPISWATQGRTRKSSVKSPKLVLPTSSEQQLPTSTDRPITPKPTPRATRDRTSRTSVRTPEAAEPAAPKLQPSSSADRPVTPKPTRWALRGRTGKAPIEITEPAELSARDPEPPTATGQPVNPESVAHGGAAPESWPPVTTDQHVPWKPSPHTGRGQRQKTAGKRGSGSAATNHQPRSEPSFGDQRAGRRRAAASLKAIPGPSFSQPPEAPIQAPQVPKVEAADSFGSTQEPQPAASQQRKRPSPGTDPAPLLKRPQREGSHKTVVPKEEEEEVALEKPEKAEDVVTPEPGKRKRSHTEEEPQEAPKRGLRRTKSTQPSAAPKVLFTGVLDARGEQAVLALGGSLASSVAEASHLVTDRVRRTVKFLCALGKGIPVLSLEWLHQSRKAGHFLPPDQYVVTDPEQERNFGFSLQDALSRARERRLLEGYEIYVTPGVQPPPLQMGEIISCCGGTILPSMPRSYKPQRVVITCPQDLPRCSLASRAGLPLLSAEFLLTGVLKQEVRPEAFVLSSQEPAST